MWLYLSGIISETPAACRLLTPPASLSLPTERSSSDSASSLFERKAAFDYGLDLDLFLKNVVFPSEPQFKKI